MKKILFISHKYPPSVGGMEKQSYELINGMTKYARVIAIVYDVERESKLKFFWELKSRVAKVLEEHPDLSAIHLNDGLMAAFSLLLRKMTNIRVYITFHGLDLSFPSIIYQKLIIPKFKNYDGFIAVSRHTAILLLDKGFPESKIEVINNGVDISRNTLNDTSLSKHDLVIEDKLKNKRILLAVGRPVRRKGFSWFVENVLKDLPKDIVLIVAGSFDSKITWLERLMVFLPMVLKKHISLFLGFPDDKSRLRFLSNQPLYSDRLILVPRLSDEELKLAYQKADLFIMPNVKISGDMEGFGLVALESIIQGLPVLASNIEGIKDAVSNNNNGFLINSANASDWKSAIIQLLSNRVTLAHITRKHRAYTLNKFSWEIMCKKYANYMKLFSNDIYISKAYKAHIKQKEPA